MGSPVFHTFSRMGALAAVLILLSSPARATFEESVLCVRSMLSSQGYPIRNDFPSEFVRIGPTGEYVFHRDTLAFRKWRLRSSPRLPDSAFALNYLTTEQVYDAAQRESRYLSKLNRPSPVRTLKTSAPRIEVPPESQLRAEPEWIARTRAMVERIQARQQPDIGFGFLPEALRRTMDYVREEVPIGKGMGKPGQKILIYRDQAGNLIPFFLRGGDHESAETAIAKADPDLKLVFSGFGKILMINETEGVRVSAMGMQTQFAYIDWDLFPPGIERRRS